MCLVSENCIWRRITSNAAIRGPANCCRLRATCASLQYLGANADSWCSQRVELGQRDVVDQVAKKPVAEQVEEKAGVKMGVIIRLLVAAWVLPGCGHFLLGRKGRAVILFVSIVTMFLLGVAMQGEFFSMHSPAYLRRLGFLGEMCVGVAMPAVLFFGYGGGDPFFVTSDYGTAFLVAAGMLNVLAMLDAYDIAMGRKN